jgi:hypothetical protein
LQVSAKNKRSALLNTQAGDNVYLPPIDENAGNESGEEEEKDQD